MKSAHDARSTLGCSFILGGRREVRLSVAAAVFPVKNPPGRDNHGIDMFPSY